jgi:calcium/calmodulin-dependent protein kinase (CaM kinase) II
MYVRLTQRRDETGQYSTAAAEETRIWQRKEGRWKHVHFHRSACGTA